MSLWRGLVGWGGCLVVGGWVCGCVCTVLSYRDKCLVGGYCGGMMCGVCGRLFEWSGRGRRPVVCGQRCRKRRSRLVGGLPGVLVDRRVWAVADGKRPVMVDGCAASSTDSSTWCSFGEVAGVPHGVMLGGGLGCWDLDHCFDGGGGLLSWARVVVAEVGVGAVWVERSLSGDGLHLFVVAEEGRGWRRGGVEFYSRDRFVVVTGDRVDVGSLLSPLN